MKKIKNYYEIRYFITFFVIFVSYLTNNLNIIGKTISGGNIMKLKTNLAFIMLSKDMKQCDLARKTGIRPATINEYYNDCWKSIKKKHIELICEVLECDISDIFKIEKTR